MKPRLFALTALLTTATASAQVTVRDTIVPLSPISICQDGATHRTLCTNHRLRPGTFGNLQPFEGQALEITGIPGAVTCPFVDVTAVTTLGVHQASSTTLGATTMAVAFEGASRSGGVFLLFLAPSIRTSPLFDPRVTGPVHLDNPGLVFSGLFQPAGLGTAYHTLTVPRNPALIGLTFYHQAVAVQGSGALETTNVDCFSF